MTDPKTPDENEVHDEHVPSDEEMLADDALRSLLRRSAEADVEPPAPDLLPAVQRKIRQRSRGKFFADGWSTTDARVSYALVALVMLLVIGVAYIALGPTGFAH